MIEAKPGIYLITNKVNGKKYVGQSTSVYNRIASHKSAARRKNDSKSIITNALKKYGIDNFTFEVLLYCPKEMLNELEVICIDVAGSLKPKGYNLATGGNSASGFKHSSEANARKSKIMREVAARESWKNAVGNRTRILWQTDAYRNKVIMSRLGKRAVPVSCKSLTTGLELRFKSIKEAAEQLNILNSSITNALKGRSKTAGGFTWKYE